MKAVKVKRKKKRWAKPAELTPSQALFFYAREEEKRRAEKYNESRKFAYVTKEKR